MDRVRKSSWGSPGLPVKRPVSRDGAGLPPRTEDLTRARILLIDDEEPNLVLLRRLLTRRGYTRLADTTDPLQAFELPHRELI